MASLLDIAPVTETVSINGTGVTVTGVSAQGVAHLLSRFPEIRMMMTGKAPDPARLVEMGGEAIAALIAAGTGHPGDQQHEAIASTLSMEAQMDLISSIIRVTLPGGPGPFVEKLTALMAGVGAHSSSAQATKSPKASKA